jgi:ABC-2 type transport system permease protein
MNYVIAETIKTRRTILSYFILLAPIINVILCFMMAGPFNIQTFELYWWATFMIPALTALFCSEHERQNKKSGNDKMLYTYPIDLYRFRTAGIAALSVKLFWVYLAMAVVSVVSTFFLGELRISYGMAAVSYLILYICSLWMVPACLLLSRYMNIYILLSVHVVLNILLPAFVADTPLWVICPYCYGPKAIEALAGIKVSGDYIAPQGVNLTVLIAVALSLVVFPALSIWESKLYNRGFHEKRVKSK